MSAVQLDVGVSVASTHVVDRISKADACGPARSSVYTITGTVPVLVIVNVRDVAEPTICDPKSIDAGVTATSRAPARLVSTAKTRRPVIGSASCRGRG